MFHGRRRDPTSAEHRRHAALLGVVLGSLKPNLHLLCRFEMDDSCISQTGPIQLYYTTITLPGSTAPVSYLHEVVHWQGFSSSINVLLLPKASTRPQGVNIMRFVSEHKSFVMDQD